MPNWNSTCCPSCGHINSPVEQNVQFPRPAKPEDEKPAAATEEGETTTEPNPTTNPASWKMDGEFLLARPAANQTPSDSVIAGLPLDAAAAETPAPTRADEHVEPAEKAEQVGTAMTRPTRNGTPKVRPGRPTVGKGQWLYLLKGKQQGPVSTEELRQLIASGGVNRSVLVWHRGQKGWTPIDEVEELAEVKSPPPPKPSADIQLSSKVSKQQLMRELAHRCSLMIWLLIAAGCLVLMALVTQRTFVDVGQAAVLGVNLTLGAGIVAMITYGCVYFWKHKPLFHLLPINLRMEAIGGLVGLGACLVVTVILSISLQSRRTILMENQTIYHAQHIYDTLTTGEIGKSDPFVDWENLQINEDDFGGRYQMMNDEEKTGAIKKFLDEFDKTFNPRERFGSELKNWQIRHIANSAIVTATYPGSTKHVLTLTLRDNKLVRIEFRQVPTTQPAATQPASQPS
jgi:hypothetical protein